MTEETSGWAKKLPNPEWKLADDDPWAGAETADANGDSLHPVIVEGLKRRIEKELETKKKK